MKRNTFSKTAVAAAMACVIAAGSLTVYAAYRYLTPSQIVEELGENGGALQKAFDSADAIRVNETQSVNGYDITLLGLVSGRDLMGTLAADETGNNQDADGTFAGVSVQGDQAASGLDSNMTYAAIAIAHTDGSAMTQDESKCVSPLIGGTDWMQVNNGTLDAGLRWFDKDGVVYELLECKNLEIFADRGVQIGVVDSFGDESLAFSVDAKTGAYSKKEGYDGTNALFSVPFDAAKADKKAADALLEKIARDIESDETDVENDTAAAENASEDEKYMDAALNAEDAAAFLKEHAVPVEGTKQTLTPDKEGSVTYGTDESAGGCGTVLISGLETGTTRILGAGSDGTLEGVELNVFTLNEDGTVTYEVYRPVGE
ncbi:MAG TPA: hypothetical protein DF613_03865 [Lachnospiraceae bacterium]|nr:hypothetical protein [Lachnospiraceae bacterium]